MCKYINSFWLHHNLYKYITYWYEDSLIYITTYIYEGNMNTVAKISKIMCWRYGTGKSFFTHPTLINMHIMHILQRYSSTVHQLRLLNHAFSVMICYTLYLNEFMYFRTEESKRSKLHSNHDWYYYAFHSKVIYKFHSKVIHKSFSTQYNRNTSR